MITLKELLKPISKNNPAGVDLRVDKNPFFYELKEARSRAKLIEKKNLQPVSFASCAEWNDFLNLALPAFSETKDIEISSWVIEALLRLGGFCGLKQGFSLASQLLISFKEGIHPRENKSSDVLLPLAHLNGIDNDGTLLAPIALIPLVETNEQESFSLWQYQQALEARSKSNDLDVYGLPTYDALISTIKKTSSSQLEKTKNEIRDCIDAFNHLSETVSLHFPEAIFPVSRIKNQLQACMDCIMSLSAYAIASVVTNKDRPLPVKKEKLSKSTSRILTRQEALNAIQDASTFFKNTEPHSPLPYLLEKALSWGKMDFPLLLKELIRDDSMRNQIYQLTGIYQEK